MYCYEIFHQFWDFNKNHAKLWKHALPTELSMDKCHCLELYSIDGKEMCAISERSRSWYNFLKQEQAYLSINANCKGSRAYGLRSMGESDKYGTLNQSNQISGTTTCK